jgi:CRISPR-associated Csx2 family protein
MSRKLITFLGRGPYRPDGSRGEYRLSKYQFPSPNSHEGWISAPNKVFATAISQWAEEVQKRKFEKIVVLGTSGSAWDILAERFSRHGADWETEQVLEMIELVDTQSVTESALEKYSAEFPDSIELQLIPSGASLEDQSQVLNIVTNAIREGDRVWLDVTHGYRHLPMLGLASAAIGTRLIKAEIEEIGYGAGDMTLNGITPVISLLWVLRLMEVLSACTVLDDYQLLRPLIGCFPNGTIRNALEDAAYKIDVMRIDEAALAVRKAVKQLESEIESLGAELKTVAAPLIQRLERFSRHERTAKGLTSMARLALEQDDFLRTSIFLAEAIDIAAVQGIPGDNQRDSRLKAVRNWLAHAGKLRVPREDRDIRELVSSRNHLRKFLLDQVDRLWQELTRNSEI